MSLVDKFKDWFLVSNNSTDALDDDDFNEPEENKNESNSYHDDVHSSKSSYSDDYETNNNQNCNNLNTKAEAGKNFINVNARLEVVLVRPEVFTDAKQIADHLMKRKTVVLNLENAKPENKRRIIDFLAGVAYANGGSIKAVANLTYIITPCNVGFVGDDLVGELENSGVIM